MLTAAARNHLALLPSITCFQGNFVIYIFGRTLHGYFGATKNIAIHFSFYHQLLTTLEKILRLGSFINHFALIPFFIGHNEGRKLGCFSGS